MICPNLKCGRTVVATESARGKVVRCAHCGTLFMVPREAKPATQVKPAEPTPEQAKRSGP
jgi:predicted Zn finger-like uncharacterized protein